MKKNKKVQKTDPKPALRFIGLVLGIISKALLEEGGCVVDYKINGEDITAIEKLECMEISERIKLAVQEERYEDVANLKKILQEKQRRLGNN